jgi:RimJ/RimL family protein N-acetyltransferase
MAFAAVVGPPERERIVGASSYYVDLGTRLADVAYMVDPEWQGVGLGSLLHTRMVDYARDHGVRGFTADVLARNTRMLKVFRRWHPDLASDLEAGVYEVTMTFS